MKTSLYTILCIVVRLGAVIIGIELLIQLPGWWYSLNQNARSVNIWMPLAFWAVLILLAFVLWIYPGLLARAAAGRSAKQVFESPISSGELMHIAFAGLGAYYVLWGLWAGVHRVLYLMLLAEITGDQAASSSARTQCWVDIGSDVVAVILGVALVLGARGLSELLRRLRYGNAKWEEQS